MLLAVGGGYLPHTAVVCEYSGLLEHQCWVIISRSLKDVSMMSSWCLRTQQNVFLLACQEMLAANSTNDWYWCFQSTCNGSFWRAYVLPQMFFFNARSSRSDRIGSALIQWCMWHPDVHARLIDLDFGWYRGCRTTTPAMRRAQLDAAGRHQGVAVKAPGEKCLDRSSWDFATWLEACWI